jgi:hypothetical protein
MTRSTYDDGSEYKGENHKLYEYSDRAMADLKVQTRQRLLRNQCLLSTSHYDLVWTRKVQ